MNRSEKFKEVFGIYTEEFWAKPEQEMLEWINEEVESESKVKVIHGLYPHGDLAYNVYICGVCGKPLPWMEIGHNYDEMPKYCSHCGAKLEWK